MELNSKLDSIIEQLDKRRHSIVADSRDPYANEDSDWRAGIRKGLEIAAEIVRCNKN